MTWRFLLLLFYLSRSLLKTNCWPFFFKSLSLSFFVFLRVQQQQVITVNGARVVRPDIKATNGIIHIVDRVIFPVPQADIYNTLKNDPQKRWTTLVSAIDRAGLQSVLANPTGKI